MKQQNQLLGETERHTDTEDDDDDLHHNHNNVDDSQHEYLSSPERNHAHHQTIPRRFPRIGSVYQTRISKSTEPSDRPPPDRMSKDYPYISEIEESKGKQFNNTDNNFGKVY